MAVLMREPVRAYLKKLEPYILGLSQMLLMPAPTWLRRTPVKDNWQTSPRGAAGAQW
jgi:hypothetical protein